MARMEQDNEKPASRKVIEPEQPKQEWQFNMGWILVPLVLLGMAYMFSNSRSSITWEYIMDILNVHNRERYTMLFHLGLVIVFIVAAVRILGRKEKK
ncbi:MAG: hypothetical protein E4H27_04110 [Anaerolineales bacterium]|jgi:hypothetical protein|nr:MAG: hypothetical protein E4H27_04110 [Anaerolineales bacterium]